jgi:hypothetical protein
MKQKKGIARRMGAWGLSLVTVVAVSGCGSSSSALAPTTVATLATETFSGSIDQSGTKIYPFTVTAAGDQLLAGFTSILPTSVTGLGMGIGNYDPTTLTCSLNVTQNDTARSGNTGLSGTPASGSYCLRIYDGGNIPAGVTVSYTAQVQHY